MSKEKMLELLKAALEDLYDAYQELAREVTPCVPMPRPRVFQIAPGWAWPHMDGGKSRWSYITKPGGGDGYICGIASDLGGWLEWKPRAILRALRRLQAAAAWCRARKAGRKRAAEEILRQQRRAVEALEAEAAVRALGR